MQVFSGKNRDATRPLLNSLKVSSSCYQLLALRNEESRWQSYKKLHSGSLTKTNNQRTKLSGKAVILDFWATYCPPCREEIPHLNSLLAKYGADNLQIVGLNVGGAEDLPRIPEFVKNTKIDYPIAFPEDELTHFVFGTRDDIPQTAVFDRKGKMITKIVGFSPAIQKELDAAVEQALIQP